MAYRTSIQVRFGDVDHAGIVYYPRYFIYFHEAFEDFFNDNGHSYQRVLDEDKLGFPTVHIETDYQAPLRYGDSLDLEVSVTRVGQRSATFRYVGYRHRDGVLACTADITVACVDMKTFTSLPFPDRLRALFATIAASAPGANAE
jgi:4-hydroxybenzoyl-CoA thioesterase